MGNDDDIETYDAKNGKEIKLHQHSKSLCDAFHKVQGNVKVL